MIVAAKSALLRFRLGAKPAPTPLRLLSPHRPFHWVCAGAPVMPQSPLCSGSAWGRNLRPLPCVSSPHADRFTGSARGPRVYLPMAGKLRKKLQ